MTKTADPRPSWDEIFIQQARLIAKRSTCTRAQVGCVLTQKNIVVSMGYNGSIRGMPHCTDRPDGCYMIDGKCAASIHAEMNAVFNARSSGHGDIKNATAYVTHSPCLNCLKALMQLGVSRIVFDEEYKLKEVLDHAENLGYELFICNKVIRILNLNRD